jgi:hypothetical protein
MLMKVADHTCNEGEVCCDGTEGVGCAPAGNDCCGSTHYCDGTATCCNGETGACCELAYDCCKDENGGDLCCAVHWVETDGDIDHIYGMRCMVVKEQKRWAKWNYKIKMLRWIKMMWGQLSPGCAGCHTIWGHVLTFFWAYLLLQRINYIIAKMCWHIPKPM